MEKNLKTYNVEYKTKTGSTKTKDVEAKDIDCVINMAEKKGWYVISIRSTNDEYYAERLKKED